MAQLLGKADKERLINVRKLALLVDLDHTLIHTTNDNVDLNVKVTWTLIFIVRIKCFLKLNNLHCVIMVSSKDVFHFKLPGNSSLHYHVRLRPYTREFLKNMSTLYELHIFTFGSRGYAHRIAKIIDEKGHYFSHRILSRDECFSSHSKEANLKYANSLIVIWK